MAGNTEGWYVRYSTPHANQTHPEILHIIRIPVSTHEQRMDGQGAQPVLGSGGLSRRKGIGNEEKRDFESTCEVIQRYVDKYLFLIKEDKANNFVYFSCIFEISQKKKVVGGNLCINISWERLIG